MKLNMRQYLKSVLSVALVAVGLLAFAGETQACGRKGNCGHSRHWLRHHTTATASCGSCVSAAAPVGVTATGVACAGGCSIR